MKFEPYKSGKRSKSKNGDSEKVIYNYMKDLSEFEKMEEKKQHKVRDVFFGSV